MTLSNQNFEVIDKKWNNVKELEEVSFTYRTYKIRFYGLTVIALSNIASSLNWYCIAPVPDSANTFFNNIGLSAINWFSNVFMLSYIFAGPFSSWVFENWGIKTAIVIGSLFQLVGAWMRYFSVFVDDPTGQYALAMIGQAVCAIGQPFILNVCPPYVTLWFPADGQATATMVGGVANSVGMAVASIIVPIIVTDSSTVPMGFLVIACITSVFTIFAFFIPKKPKTPPSYIASSKDKPVIAFGQSFRELATNWNFLIIFVAFGVISGLAASLTSLIAQIVSPYGIDNDDAGYIGAAFIVAGLVGAILTGIALDKVGANPKLIVKTYVPCVGVLYLAFYFVVPTGQYGSIVAVCALMGFFTFSLLPVALELSVQSSFPISEGISSALLWMANQVLGLIILSVMDALRNPDNTYTGGLIFAACIACPLSILSTLYNSSNKRLEFENRNKEDIYSNE